MNARNILRCRSNLSCLLLLLAGLISACRPAGYSEGVALSVTIPLLSFVQPQPGGSGMKSALVDFPALEVFNGTGQLVYLGHDAARNVALVKSLPGQMDSLKVLPNQPALSQVVGSLPGLAEGDKETLTNSRQPTVIAFSLEDCNGCSLQDEALKPETIKNLTAHGLNLLAIRVSRPH